jgi:hypothetical protein
MKKIKRAHRGGRPLFDGKPEQEVLAKLEEAWALDCTDDEASAYADISPSSLSRYLASHDVVSARKLRLKANPFFLARAAIINALKSKDADTAIKYLERKLKKEFSLRSEFTGADGAPLPAQTIVYVDAKYPDEEKKK